MGVEGEEDGGGGRVREEGEGVRREERVRMEVEGARELGEGGRVKRGAERQSKGRLRAAAIKHLRPEEWLLISY